jgi:hypothetical protein
MTDDLEQRLRRYRSITRRGHPSICDEAADAIARLRAENEALREALRPVADVNFLGAESTYQDGDLVMITVGEVRRARAALKRIAP